MMAIPNSWQRVLCLLSLVYVGIVAMLLLLPDGRVVLADDEKTVEQIQGDARIEVLRFLAARNEANYRKIQTWRGKYHFVDRFPTTVQIEAKKGSEAKNVLVPPPIPRREAFVIREGTVEFVLDMAADKLWSDYQEDESKAQFLSLDLKEKLTPLRHKPASEKQIVTADRLTKLREDANYGPLAQYADDPHHVRKTTSKLAEKDTYPPHERQRDADRRLDPRRFYSTSAVPVSEKFANYAKALTGGYGEEERARVSRLLEINKSGIPGAHEYTVKMRFYSNTPEDEKGLAMDVTRFAERDAYLPIEQTFYDTEGGTVHQHRSWVYQRTNDVLIPKEFHITINGARGGKLILDRHLRLVEGVLNEPLSEETFSAEHLGLSKADRLEDKVEKRLFVSDGNKLLPAEQFAFATQEEHPARWFIWLNGCLLLAALTTWLVWRYIGLQRLKAGS